jgi:predicted Zn-dependent peptidase
MWLATGSRHEKPGEAGKAHFMEHLLFKGTRSRTAEQISLEIDRVGGDLNARTDRETTGYLARVPDGHLDMAVDLLGDMLTHPALPPEGIATERQVIEEEIKRYEDTPDELVVDHAIEALWPESPAGAPITGTLADLEGIDRAGLLAYHGSRYRVSMAGNLDPEEATELAERSLADLPDGEPERSPEPIHTARETLRCTTKDLEQVHLVLGWAGCGACSHSRYAQALVDGMFGATTSSRLFLRIREERGLVYSVWSEPLLLSDTGALLVCADTSPGNVPEVLRLIYQEARHLSQGRFSDDELEVSREQFKGSTALALESTDSRETRNARAMIFLGQPVPFEEVERRANAVTRHQAEEMGASLFDQGQPCVAAIGPIEEKELRQALDDAWSARG